MFNVKIAQNNVFHPDTSRLLGDDRNQPAWWRVDLGASYEVYQVIIVNRNQNQGNQIIVTLVSRHK